MPALNPALVLVIISLIAAPTITYKRTHDARRAIIAGVVVLGVWALLGLVDIFFIE